VTGEPNESQPAYDAGLEAPHVSSVQ